MSSQSTSTSYKLSTKLPTSTGAAVKSLSKKIRLTSTADSPESSESQELWKWTLTPDAIAPCRVRDVFAMKENGSRGKSVSTLHNNVRITLDRQMSTFSGW